MKIAIFLGSGQYNVARFMLEQLADALSSAGHLVLRLEADSHLPHRLRAAVQRGVKAVVAYNSFGSELFFAGSGPLLRDVRFVAWLVDHPAYHAARIDASSSSALICCVDATHHDYLDDFGPARQLAWLPHFACRLGNRASHTRDRDIAVLVPGTFRHSGRFLKVIEDLPLLQRCVCLDAALTSVGVDGVPVHRALFDRIDLELRATLSADDVHRMVRAVDGYLRSRRRELCLASLASAGVRATVCGNVDPEMSELASHDVLPACDEGTLISLLRRTRVAVDPGAGFIWGGHERGLSAMAAGAAVVCERNSFWSRAFVDGQEFAGFEWGALSELGARVRGLLDDPEWCQSVATRAMLVVEGRHLAVHRAARLVEIIDGAREPPDAGVAYTGQRQ